MVRRTVLAGISTVLAIVGCGSSSSPRDSGAGAGSGGGAGLAGSGAASGGTSASGTAGESSGGSAGHGESGGAAGIGGSGGESVLRIHYHTDSNFRIALRGQGPNLDWDTSTPTTQIQSGIWEHRFQGLTSGLQFKPVLESNGGEVAWPKGASFSNWLLEPGESLDIFPFFFTEQGRLETFQVAHPDGPRDVVVYLPPSYDEPGASDKRYPVLILQDGQNLFDESAFFGGWRLRGSLDALLGAGQVLSPSNGQVSWEGGSAEEVIVAGVFNAGAGRVYEYTPTNASVDGLCDAQLETCGGGASDYLDFVTDVVAPELRSRYRADGARLGFGGSSLGGLLALQACWTRGDAFERCFVMSPSLWWDDEWALRTLLGTHFLVDPARIYLDAGTSSDGLEQVRELNSRLETLDFTTGADLWCLEGIGMAHDELAWAERAPWAVYWGYRDPHRVQPPPVLPSDLRPCQ
ncbi:MAG: alpha/beta hydrolase [Myxococcales bacterium]|nr:alpha/beta hydrolase [Myxococcales bacterium]